jgi:hypothetical protein
MATAKKSKKRKTSSKGGRPELPDSVRKIERMSIRSRSDILDKFQAATFLRGANMSLEIHKFMVNYIREEEGRNAEELNRLASNIHKRKEAKRKQQTRSKTE